MAEGSSSIWGCAADWQIRRWQRKRQLFTTGGIKVRLVSPGESPAAGAADLAYATGRRLTYSAIRAGGCDERIMRIKQEPKVDAERRGCQRFKVNAPLSLLIGDQSVAGYTRDMSNQGAYFFLSSVDSANIQGTFEFLIDLPPEVTLSTRCRIKCMGKALRTEHAAPDLTGIAVEILDYSITR